MWIWDGLANALRMAWEVWWALVLGFALSGVVQAWVPRERLRAALGGRGVREAALATGLGAASSSCSYAAIAIAKSLFEKGASLASAMAFQFASTNLVFELGIVLWLFVGWRFTLAEFVGGLLLIAAMWLALHLLVSREREEQVRVLAAEADTGHVHPTAASDLPLRRKLVSLQAWSDVAHNFRGDWQMLWKEIGAGFLIAGYVSLLPRGFFNGLFVTHAASPLRLLENVVVGPVVAALAFVCSIGNVPLAAVLWAGGISFSGVIAFLFADLLIPPIVAYYRKVYGGRFAALLVAVMFGATVAAALAVDGLFSLAGLVPSHRPAIASIADRPVTWNYTSILDILFALVFVALIALTVRRGARDPVCGMTVDRHAGKPTSVYAGRKWFFCGQGCKKRFDADPAAFSSRSRAAASAPPTSHG
ncbi:MAG TPA: permease [Gaiellaceae bacterium]|nr:permease [Gaiellaceae bacterium]